MKIVSLNTKRTYDIHPTGNTCKIQCPECSNQREKHKNDKPLSWNNIEKVGKCHHCNASFVEWKALKEEKQYNKPIWKNITTLSDKAVKYFESRKISQKTLSEMKIYTDSEWMPQHNASVECICFPYFYDNELINIKFRGPEKSFKLAKDAELILYNLDCVNEYSEIIIVEGEFDALAFIEAGLKNVVSVPNGASKNLTYLDKYIELFDEKKIIIAVDNDPRGFELKQELIRRFGDENCSTIDFRDCKDANEFLIKNDTIALNVLYENRIDVPVSGIVNLDNNYDSIYNLFLNGMQKGIEIGDDLDKIVTWESGRLAIWTGIPSHGKSEVLDYVNVKMNIQNKWKIAYFSPENFPIEYHFSKIFSKISGKSFNSKFINKNEFEHVYNYIKDNFYFLMPEDNFTIDTILEKAKFLIRKKGIKVLIIDPYNKIEHKRTSGQSETEYISVLLDKLVNFARRNDILIHLVAHPTKMKKDIKNIKYEVPTLYDIAGSANFYNKADYGITVYRNWKPEETTDIYIQKVKFKHLGDGGVMQKRYNSINGRYEYYGLLPEQFTFDNMLTRPIEDNYINFENKQVNTGIVEIDSPF